LSKGAKQVLVIGGGIAGLSSAWELARLKVNVLLVEKSGFLGGHAIQFCCKATDKCQKCGACATQKRLKEVLQEPGVRVHLKSELKEVIKDARFRVTINRRPILIDPQKCTNCGICLEKCPAGAVKRGHSGRNTCLYEIDENECLYFKDRDCTICRDECPEGAINLDQQELSEAVQEVDAIIVASGFTPYNPIEKTRFGYGINKNLITGLELERMLRQKGRVLRPSDHQVPQKVAFIQCVGSRDPQLKHVFCSQVCCPYALRMARVIRHRSPETKVSVFYMDIQTFGNDFPRFYRECESDLRMIRCMPGHIFQGDNDRLILRYVDEKDGGPVKEVFDLVVLSIGIMPGETNKRVAELLGLRLDENGFFAVSNGFKRTSTNQEGIFLAGTSQGPKSILDSMAHAGHAAREVARYLGVLK